MPAVVLKSKCLQEASDGTAAKAKECIQALELDKGLGLALGHAGALGEAGGAHACDHEPVPEERADLGVAKAEPEGMEIRAGKL